MRARFLLIFVVVIALIAAVTGGPTPSSASAAPSSSPVTHRHAPLKPHKYKQQARKHLPATKATGLSHLKHRGSITLRPNPKAPLTAAKFDGKTVSPKNLAVVPAASGTASISGTVLLAGSPNKVDTANGGAGVYLYPAYSAPFGPSNFIATTTASTTTGAFSFSNLAPGKYTLRFYPVLTPYATEWLGKSAGYSFATVITVAAGQKITGTNMVLPLGAQVKVTVAVQDVPKVLLSNGLFFGLQPEENCNCVLANDNFSAQGNLNGDGTYSLTATNLPGGNFTVFGGLSGDFFGPFAESFLVDGSYTSSTDIGPTFVPVGEGKTVDLGNVGTVSGKPLPIEQRGGYNPSELLCDCERADPIGTATGELDETSTDLAIPGVGPDVSAKRSYSSLLADTNGMFGYGWSSPLAMSLSTEGAALTPGSYPSTIDWLQENGSAVRFFQDSGSQTTYGTMGVDRATISWNASAQQWTIVRNLTTTFVFDAAGRLLSETDLNGNSVTFAHDASGVLTSVSGSGGRKLTLTYAAGLVSSIADSAGRSVAYAYDANGNLATVKDADGNVTTYGYSDVNYGAPTNHLLSTTTTPQGVYSSVSYDSSYRVTQEFDGEGRETDVKHPTYGQEIDTQVTQPDGAVTTDGYVNGLLVESQHVNGLGGPKQYVYDSFGNILTSYDGNENTETYTYDSAGNMLTKVDRDGQKTTYVYNSLNEQTSVTDPLGRVTAYGYDAHGNLTSETSPSGRKQSWTRNTDGTPATWTDGNGNVTTYGYSTTGQLTSTTDALTHKSSTAYNAAGFVTSTTDAAGKVTSYVVDALGRVTKKTDPNSRVTTYTYNADGQLTTVTDPTNAKTTYTYDEGGEKSAMTDPLGNQTQYTYTGVDGHVATVTDPLGNVTTYQYDYMEQLFSVTDADGNQTAYAYDIDNRPTMTTLPSGSQQTTYYDPAGYKTSQVDAAGKTTNYVNDADGEPTKVTDPLNRVTTYTYTADGQMSSKTLPSGKTESYGYDNDGNETKLTDADGKVTTYAFDAANNLKQQSIASSITTKYAYDADNRLSTQTNADASVVTNTYDAASQLTKTHYSQTGSTDTTFTYDGDGRRKTMADTSGTTTTTYDLDGRALSEKNGAGSTIGYTYTTDSQLATITYPTSHVVTYGYDAAGLMTSVKDWLSKSTSFTWTSDGKLATQAMPNGLTQTLAYDGDDRLTSATTTSSSATVAKYGYGYDAASEITSDSTVDPTTTASGVTHTDSYDANAQLSGVTTSGTTAAYTATAAGVLSALPSKALTVNGADQLTKVTPTSGAASTFTYTANGSRSALTVAANGSTPAATTTYTYAPSGAMATAVLPNSGGTVTYKSNGDGLRETRTLGSTTTKYLWSTALGTARLLDDGTTSYVYGPNGRVVDEIVDSSQAPQYPVLDLLQSVRLLTSAAAAVVGTYTYGAFGAATHTGTAASGLQYAGELIDASTGFTYLRARDYDAATAQFIEADPLFALTEQAYTYVRNNPLALTDPSGEDALRTLATIGLVAGGIALALTGVGIFVDLGFAGAAAITALTAVGSVTDGIACHGGDGLGCAGLVVNVAGGVGAGASYFATDAIASSIADESLSEEVALATSKGFNAALFPIGAVAFGLDTAGTIGTYREELARERERCS